LFPPSPATMTNGHRVRLPPASRGCAPKAAAWAGNRAPSRTISSRLSRVSRPGTGPSGSASRTRWSPAGAL
jgi:hypothetical protein